MFNTYLNKLISIIHKHRTYPLVGFVCHETKKRVILISNPVDFVIDGYIYIKKEHIKKVIRDDKIKFIEKVILKNNKISTISLPKSNIRNYFKNSKQTIQLEKKSENICQVGKISDNKKREIILNELSSKGIRGKEKSHQNKKDINIIFTDTNYINSLEKFADNT